MAVQLSTIGLMRSIFVGVGLSALVGACCRTAPYTRTGPEDSWESLGSDQKFRFFLAGRNSGCRLGEAVCYKGEIRDVSWAGGCMWPGEVSFQRNSKELEQKISQFCPSGQTFKVTDVWYKSCRTLFGGQCK